jgi:iron(II)-dependent oxidoreductase
MDIFPVTNLNYSVYLAETKYSPTDNYRWLQNWNGSTSIPPDAIKDVPVTYVSLNEARAYCSWRNARLPHEHEWQYAAQGNDGRIWPWGNDNDQSKYPTETSGTKYLGPEKVNTYSLSSASPFGVRDLVGNVYQYTDEFQDDHTRAVILRGGSNYRPSGSQWYFPQAKQNNQHEKYFLMNDRYERAGTIGFRCVQDA